MEKYDEMIYGNIVENISDGILVVEWGGKIRLANQSAEEILGIPVCELQGKKLAKLMLEQDENDEFFQCILDAVYAKSTITEIVPYSRGGEKKRLRMVSSLLKNGEENVGLIITLNDLTAMVNLMERNELLNQKLTEFIDRFTEVMVGAIEARTPYNANHTKNMVRYASNFLDWREAQGKGMGEMRMPFLVSIWLHDVGKLVVPRSIMDKATRLGNREAEIRYRIENAILCERLRAAENPDRKEEARAAEEKLRSALELIQKVNGTGFLGDELREKIEGIKDLRCLTLDGGETPLLQPGEYDALTVQRGTLTTDERKIIESHVTYTRELLERMGFEDIYGSVAEWAGCHHEYLDGSGYPKGLKGDQISWESRLITIIDIFDSLTADDRPYKPAITTERAFQILESMCREGKLDGEILREFQESKAWENVRR